MALIQLPIGSVYLFADGDVGVQQIAGTDDVFAKGVYNSLNITNNSITTVSTGASLNVNGTLRLGRVLPSASGSALFYKKYTFIDPTVIPTSSITTGAGLLLSGSFFRIRGTDNHMLKLDSAMGDSNNGLTVHYMKNSAASTELVVQSTAANGISGQTQWSSSDAYASIELVYHNIAGSSDWTITSKVGNWY